MRFSSGLWCLVVQQIFTHIPPTTLHHTQKTVIAIFVYRLFNYALNFPDRLSLNSRIDMEYWIENRVEVSGISVIILEGLRKIRKNLFMATPWAKVWTQDLPNIRQYFYPIDRRYECETDTCLKSSVFWDITTCSPLKVNGRTGFFIGVFFDPEDGGNVFFEKWLTYSGLHGIISQKVELFITTGVRTSNPKQNRALTTRCWWEMLASSWLTQYVRRPLLEQSYRCTLSVSCRNA
jgi:hypothetical protein